MGSRLYLVADWPALVRQTRYRCEDLAASCGVSERHLERIFLAQFGQTPKEWIQHFRMRRALQLIRQGYSTKAAAADICYHGPCQFCREFLKYFGRAPQSFAPQSLCRISSMMSDSANPTGLNGDAAQRKASSEPLN
jgi:AraC-like DNA-binding protein